jgi:hypothetical protein
MLGRATADLEQSEREYRLIQQRLEDARSRVEELRAMRDGARMLLERYGDDKPPDGGSDLGELSSLSVITEVSQTDLCEKELRELGRPATTREIHERLSAAGYKFNFEQVRSALGYLKRKDRVERAGPATWQFPRTREAENFAPVTTPNGDERSR